MSFCVSGTTGNVPGGLWMFGNGLYTFGITGGGTLGINGGGWFRHGGGTAVFIPILGNCDEGSIDSLACTPGLTMAIGGPWLGVTYLKNLFIKSVHLTNKGNLKKPILKI